MKLRDWALTSFFALALAVSHSQLSVTGDFANDTIEIGGEVDFTLVIRAGKDKKIFAIPRSFVDTIYSALQTFNSTASDTSSALKPMVADFDLMGLGLWQDNDGRELFQGDELVWQTDDSGHDIVYENTFRFRFWDPGEILLLLPPVFYMEGGTSQKFYDGGSALIFVAPPAGLEGVDQDSLSMAPIKPILNEFKDLTDYLIYIYTLGGLLFISLLYWFFRKKSRKSEESEVLKVPEVFVPAHEKALLGLRSLKEQELWQKGQIKKYQSGLTFIIREYLENRFEVEALEMTTDEITKRLQKGILKEENIHSLRHILQVADLVKFARATPEISVHDQFMQEAIAFVHTTRKEVKTEERHD